MAPTISILLPAFNSEEHLAEAVHSILSQTYEDFELLIIDDGSTDRTREIARTLATDDPRIRLLEHDDNRGLPARLNEGLSLAQGDYIARMDADDVSRYRRLELQLKYLQTHPDVALVGGFIRLFGAGRSCTVQVATSPSIVRWRLLFGNSIGHVTILGRSKFFSRVGGYDEKLRVAQDYDLWLRGSTEFKLANIPEVVVDVRENSASTSRSRSAEREFNAINSLNRAHCDVLKREVPKEVSTLCFAPGVLRTDESYRRHFLEALKTIEEIAAVCLVDPYLTKSEERLIRKDARYKLARLALIQTRYDRKAIFFGNELRLARTSDLPIAVGKYLLNKLKRVGNWC
jgi:glycosyltransferase involved in cell wall biosynthesis